ncbi:MAG: dihydrofolate reductase [Chitinophagales bacterium]|jgi:dihydrofolate reductase|nr:dihydrofolate reductase [Sphingobacteriales bacterium]MBP7534189.1 dihydrofolate reductase [Chitinophagales bacterium]
MIISLIAAATRNYVIGKDGGMPWHQPADLAYFKRTTIGHCVVMGRKTFEEFGLRKPLPKRTNIIVSRNPNLVLEGCYIANSLRTALDIAQNANETECFIIGGEQIYRLALPYANRIYLTYIETELEGDTFFPVPNWAEWTQTLHQEHPADTKNQYNYTFTVWEKKQVIEPK